MDSLQTTVVVETHRDAEQLVNPLLIEGDRSRNPKEVPTMVMLMPSCTGRFDGRSPEIDGTSNDIPDDRDPIFELEVSTSSPLGAPPCMTLHKTDVTDTHFVTSHPLPPTLPALLWSHRPTWPPRMVMLRPPLCRTLPKVLPLISCTSYDVVSVSDPKTRPAVATAVKLAPTPTTALQRIEVSDSQPVPSCLLPPEWDPVVKVSVPSWPPRKVRLTPPPRSTFWLPVLDKLARSNDNTSVMLPTARPTVTDTLRLALRPCAPLHRSSVSDTQSVPSQPVAPTRPATL
jgi:hypothetical protein